MLGGGTVTGGSIGEAIRNGFPARYLEPGDVVEIEVEGIGVLRNTIAPKTNPDSSYRFKAPRRGLLFDRVSLARLPYAAPSFWGLPNLSLLRV